MAALEGEELFEWLYERRENIDDELSFDQFGHFTPALAERLALEWFPNSTVRQGMLKCVSDNHPKRQQYPTAQQGNRTWNKNKLRSILLISYFGSFFV
jgi:hypothetical protein